MRSLMVSYEVAKSQSDASAMIAAARELGKMCGFYDPSVDEGPPACDVEPLGDAQAIVSRAMGPGSPYTTQNPT